MESGMAFEGTTGVNNKLTFKLQRTANEFAAERENIDCRKLTLQEINRTPIETKTERGCSRRQLFRHFLWLVSTANYGSVWMHLSLQLQTKKKERVICEFEMDFNKKRLCWCSNMTNDDIISASARSKSGCGKWHFFSLKYCQNLETRAAHPH